MKEGFLVNDQWTKQEMRFRAVSMETALKRISL
jgi:hypothetical protein